jgi:hypothetical protein
MEGTGMSALEAIAEAQAAGVNITVDGDDLLLDAQRAPPAPIVQAITHNKKEILRLLAKANSLHGLYELEERSAIVEFDGGAPREWAEGFARLDIAKPLRGFTIDRWQQLIDDGGRFLDRWAGKATELGWGATDVFGVNTGVPIVQQDANGLVSLIRGGDVVDIRADRATIKMLGGTYLTYLRRPTGNVAAVWELLQPKK